MNPDIARLQEYPFRKLAGLLAGASAPTGLGPISLSIGEPRHAPPEFVEGILRDSVASLGRYPMTRGSDQLRETITLWANHRYQLGDRPLDPGRHVLPCCGSREALFSAAQTVVNRYQGTRPCVVMPNPFYQIYEGAALLAGAEPVFMNTTTENRFIPELAAIPDEVWRRTALLYLCTPGNPTGAVLPREVQQQAIELSQQFGFFVASDECYSEIYFDESAPPPGLLSVAADMGVDDYRGCLVFQSLSKRSNLPGLRSGFVAGDGHLMEDYLRYRTYHGCTMPSVTEAVSIAAWSDEDHVRTNRDRYRAKFAAVLDILTPVLDVQRPDAGFYLWPRVPGGGTAFARGLHASQNVTVLPGSYLSRVSAGIDPGHDRVRMALVAEEQECIEAAHRIRKFIDTL